MIIIDDFLPTQHFEKVKSLFLGDSETSPYFHFGLTRIVEDYRGNSENNVQFSSDVKQDITPLAKTGFFKIIGLQNLIKFKANITFKGEKIEEHGMHCDLPDIEDIEHLNPKTAIYYLNTCDGYTSFENGKKINSVANRYIEFDAKLMHSGTNTTDKLFRAVVNLNYIPRNNFPRNEKKRFE